MTGALDAEPDRVGYRRDDPLVVTTRTPTAEFTRERGSLAPGSLVCAPPLVRDQLPELPVWADDSTCC
jgi:hypothetical protein